MTATAFERAQAHFQQGRYQDANRVLAEALRAQPSDARLWSLAGASAEALGKLDGAEQCFRRAAAAAPRDGECHFNLGLFLQRRGRIAEAVAAYREALAHLPRHARALNNLGHALLAQEQPREAMACFEQAIAADPAYAQPRQHLGRAYAQLGRMDEALQQMRAAIALAPPQERPQHYMTLAYARRFDAGDPLLEEMERLARDAATLPDEERMMLHFALGKAYGDNGRHEQSFAHLLAGNREKRRRIRYDETAQLERIERCREVFSPALPAARAGGGCRSAVPVFVIGMPRCGGTLVEQILASHPRAYGAGECEEFKELAEALTTTLALSLPEDAAQLTDEALRQLGQDYLDRLQARAPDAARIGDKSLSNFLYAGLIHLALPEAKIVHCRRDPVDTCLSCFSHLFEGELHFSYELGELGRYWQAHDRLMRHWRAVLPPGVVLELHYEELVADLEGQARRLLQHCGLEWNEACLDFHKSGRQVRTASLGQVRQPIYRGSVGRWRAYGDLLEPLLQALREPPQTPLQRALHHYHNGRYEDAGRVLGEALRLRPADPRVWNLSGAIAQAMGKAELSEQCYRRAVAAAPADAESHFNLGLLLQAQERPAEAADSFREAARLAPDHVQALSNLGGALLLQDRAEEALQCSARATAIDPAYAPAHHNLGRAQAQLGSLDEALASLRTAIALAPAAERARYFMTLAYAKRFAAGDADLAPMEALARELEALPPRQQMRLHFALGKAYGDIGEREKSFAHLLAGNRGKRRETPYDEAAELAQMRHLEQVFTPALLAARRGAGAPGVAPIFIVGMPRSGGTLIEQILASHPEVHGAGECEDFRLLAEALRLPDGSRAMFDGVAQLADGELFRLGQDYLRRLRARAPAAARIVDKTLSNFLYAGMIHLALPQAKIIHSRRDAVDTCLSCFSHLFGGNLAFTYDLAELGRFWRGYDRLMAHWRSVLPPGVMLELQYEELVDDLEGQARRLLDHCGLEWNEACLHFHQTERSVRTASLSQVRQPIYRSSVQKWRAYGELLRPLLEALQYDA